MRYAAVLSAAIAFMAIPPQVNHVTLAAERSSATAQVTGAGGPRVMPAGDAANPDGRPTESIEVDVSTRSIAVTSNFSGVEILVFGTVENSRQSSAEAGYYDVVITVSGAPGTATVRNKSKVAGVWINTDAMSFSSTPSYYAIASSRILTEIAGEKTLSEQAIGFEYLKIRPLQTPAVATAQNAAVEAFRSALIRLKKNSGLYLNNDFGVSFAGSSLFRASIKLPANVPVGPLVVTTYLFQEGRVLNTRVTSVDLQREGSERLIYNFAFGYPFLYGVACVLIAVMAGIAASALLQRGAR